MRIYGTFGRRQRYGYVNKSHQSQVFLTMHLPLSISAKTIFVTQHLFYYCKKYVFEFMVKYLGHVAYFSD